MLIIPAIDLKNGSLCAAAARANGRRDGIF